MTTGEGRSGRGGGLGTENKAIATSPTPVVTPHYGCHDLTFLCRFDHRPFLYNVGWPWQFRRMDAAVAQAEGQQQLGSGDGLTVAAAAGPALAGPGEAPSATHGLKANSIMKQFTMRGGGGGGSGQGRTLRQSQVAASEQGGGSVGGSGSGRKCYKCQGWGHYTSDCPNNKGTASEQGGGSGGSGSGGKDKGHIQCLKCQAWGHFASDCPNNKSHIQCYNCQGWGHFRNECPNNKGTGRELPSM